jgi:hypothetical protein
MIQDLEISGCVAGGLIDVLLDAHRWQDDCQKLRLRIAQQVPGFMTVSSCCEEKIGKARWSREQTRAG